MPISGCRNSNGLPRPRSINSTRMLLTTMEDAGSAVIGYSLRWPCRHGCRSIRPSYAGPRWGLARHILLASCNASIRAVGRLPTLRAARTVVGSFCCSPSAATARAESDQMPSVCESRRRRSTNFSVNLGDSSTFELGHAKTSSQSCRRKHGAASVILREKGAVLNAVLLRRFDAQCLGERGELVALLLHAGAELGRPEDRHDLTRIAKPLGDDGILSHFFGNPPQCSRA